MISKIMQLFRATNSPNTLPNFPELITPTCDLNGVPYSKIVGTVTSPTSSDAFPVEVVENNTDTFVMEATEYSLMTFSVNTLFNPDDTRNVRERSNYFEQMFSSGTRTTTQTTALKDNFTSRGIYFITNITAAPGGTDIQPDLQIYDNSGNYASIATGASLLATGTYVFKVYPGISELPGFSYNMPLPRSWRFRMIHNSGVNVTYSVMAHILR